MYASAFDFFSEIETCLKRRRLPGWTLQVLAFDGFALIFL
jgi:hypothetical protein